MPRTLRPGQRAQIFVVTIDSGERRLVHESLTLLFEAPNWTDDGEWLVVNGDGLLFRLRSDGSGELEQIDLGTVPAINNDHVMAPDGSVVTVSAEDGHLYAIPFAGGSPRRVSNDHGANFRHYLHGVSPDGQTLAYIGLFENPGGAANTNVFVI